MQAYSPSYKLYPLLWPEEPRRGNQDLDAPSYPKIELHPPSRLTNIPPHNSPNQNASESKRPPIPLDIALQRRCDIRVRGYVAKHGCEDHTRDLIHTQRSATNDLSRSLETQQRDGYLVLPHDIGVDGVQRPVHRPRLYDRRHDENDDRLQGERRDERGAPQRARILGEAGEEKASEAEADDGRQGLGPGVWL